MKVEYKIDIFEKCIEFASLFYFTFGFFTTYCWACKELDKVSNNSHILSFWEPVAAVNGIFNLANVVAIIMCIYMNRKICMVEEFRNKENNLLFHILCTPLFFISIIYLCWDFIDNCINVSTYGSMSILMTLCEMLLFAGAMFLILNVNKSRITGEVVLHRQINSLVLLLTLIGMANYFIYHMTGQQITNFVNTASNFSAYHKYYTISNIHRNVTDSIHFQKVQDYLQPLVILFSCCCLAYLVTLLYRINNNENVREENEVAQEIPSENEVSELGSRTESEENLVMEVDNVANTPPFRLPPLSLLLAILFITITILILVIVISLTTPGTIPSLQMSGELTFTLFSLPVYVISFFLMGIQINDMDRWPKLKNNKNVVDKALVWIGSAGQLIVALCQIKIISNQVVTKDNKALFVSIVIVFTLLMVQTLLQSITICLALDREWMAPVIQTWQQFICPPVGMLSINIGFFLLSVYAVKNDAVMSNITIETSTDLFLKIFGNGFNSLGETLAILSRLHASLIFGKMIAYTNKRK